ETDAMVATAFVRLDVAELMAMLEKSDIAFARVSDCALLSAHPHLRRITVDTPSGPATIPAPAPIVDMPRRYGAVPALGQHSDDIRKEFLGNTNEGKRP
ncbi:MAG: hypothetical protein AB7V13_25145, partial [Pseudorhodoplanes sp.]